MLKITQDKINQFQKITDSTKDDAIAYLEAEEGFLDDAVRSFLADAAAENYDDSLGWEVQDSYDGENILQLDGAY